MTAPRYEWDFDYWPPNRRPTIDYEQDRRGVYAPRRQPRPIGFGTCLALSALGVILLLRFFWPAAILLFAMSGITSAREMLAAVIVIVVLAAIALRERLAGR
jgi:hypothetical protein